MSNFLIGLGFGIWLAVIGFGFTPVYDKIVDINNLIEECQKELKRTENCVIVAVPMVANKQGE